MTVRNCPRCAARMTDAAGPRRIDWPQGDKYLTCLNIGCPCFITVDDGKVHFGSDAVTAAYEQVGWGCRVEGRIATSSIRAARPTHAGGEFYEPVYARRALLEGEAP